MRVQRRPINAVPARGAASLKLAPRLGAGARPALKVKSEAYRTWSGVLTSNAPLLGDTAQGLNLHIVDKNGIKSAKTSLNTWKLEPKDLKDYKKGWLLFGDVAVPDDINDPAAILLCKDASKPTEESVDYISEFNVDMGGQKRCFPVHSWVSSEHKDRVFFDPTAYLPAETPPALEEYRQYDLKQLRGETDPGKIPLKRQGAERIYGYQVYDDLGNSANPRPALGGSGVRPYPRRIATHRKMVDGQEVPVASDPDPTDPSYKGPWLPYDERFNFSKSQGFLGDTLLAAVPAAIQSIKNIPPRKFIPAFLYHLLCQLPVIGDKLPKREFPPVENFEDVRDVLSLFGRDLAARGLSVESVMSRNLYPKDVQMGMAMATKAGQERQFKDSTGNWNFDVDDATARAADAEVARARAGPAVVASSAGKPTLPTASSIPTSPSAAMPAGAAAFTDAAAIPPLTPAVAGAGAGAAAMDAATLQPAAAPPQPGLGDVLQFVRDQLHKEGGIKELLRYDVPRSLEGRPEEWHLDQELGRTALAGMHPCSLTALKAMPETLGSAIREQHVAADLQGSSMRELVDAAAAGDKPRLFWQDYWALSAYWPQMSDNTNMVQHAGRCLFYLKKKEGSDEDEALIPVAIELAHKGNARGVRGEQGVVYSRHQLNAQPNTVAVWRLAKAVFRSLDSAYHQLISHWLRTHACLEPFLIAMRRNLSIMHPVFKLMLPHFRYTLHINANARSSLINQGGVIEGNFSAGAFAMRLSSEVYKGWRFSQQALPEDLKARGMVDAKGKPWMEYAYAEDGMDLWHAFEEYFTAFLTHHYSNDGAQDVDAAIAADAELQAWWAEVKAEGHGDLVKYGLATEEAVWGFAGPIKTLDQLVRILVTIAWTASAHHAAVNFGQYDFSGLLLNFSSMVRKPMPEPGDKAYQALVDAPMGPPQERVFLSYLSHVTAAASVMTTVKLLSAHAEGEQFLDKPNEYLKDPYDEELNAKFMARMAELEKRFEARNANPRSWQRAATKVNPLTMAYNLLLPSSGSGVTGRGVPYSVSI